MPRSAELEYADNPYRSSAVASQEYSGFNSGEEVNELCAYVGPKASYYLKKWAARLEDPAGDVGINWVAFFFPSLWMAYRKMYWAVFVYFVVVFLLGAGKEALFIFALDQKAAPLLANLVFNILTGLVCALYGNAWYLAQAHRTITGLRAQGYQDQELLHALARRGGTSVLSIFLVNLSAGLVLGFVVMIMVTLAVVLRSV
jgi:Protein of unknown function (DUF2628)